jgi:hypothetical protein
LKRHIPSLSEADALELAKNKDAVNQIIPQILVAKQWQFREEDNGIGGKRIVAINPTNPMDSYVVTPRVNQQSSRTESSQFSRPDNPQVGQIYATPRGQARFLGNGQWQLMGGQ